MFIPAITALLIEQIKLTHSCEGRKKEMIEEAYKRVYVRKPYSTYDGSVGLLTPTHPHTHTNQLNPHYNEAKASHWKKYIT